MKKIIILVFAVFGIILLNMKPAHAYASQSDVQYLVFGTYGEFYDIGETSEYEIHKVNYRTTSILGYDTDNLFELIPLFPNELEIVIFFNNPNEIIGYHILVESEILQTLSHSIISYIIINADGINFYDLQSNIILTHADALRSPVEVFYTIQVNDYAGENYWFNRGYDRGYIDGGLFAFNDAKKKYGYYDGSDYITADEYGEIRWIEGYIESRDHYGYYYNENTGYITAEQWGDIRFDEGYNKGVDDEIDWWSWSTTFFLMPFRILNVEILPGVRIGYFALFSLLIGVVGWFFFIVGKGGGRKK